MTLNREQSKPGLDTSKAVTLLREALEKSRQNPHAEFKVISAKMPSLVDSLIPNHSVLGLRKKIKKNLSGASKESATENPHVEQPAAVLTFELTQNLIGKIFENLLKGIVSEEKSKSLLVQTLVAVTLLLTACTPAAGEVLGVNLDEEDPERIAQVTAEATKQAEEILKEVEVSSPTPDAPSDVAVSVEPAPATPTPKPTPDAKATSAAIRADLKKRQAAAATATAESQASEVAAQEARQADAKERLQVSPDFLGTINSPTPVFRSLEDSEAFTTLPANTIFNIIGRSVAPDGKEFLYVEFLNESNLTSVGHIDPSTATLAHSPSFYEEVTFVEGSIEAENTGGPATEVQTEEVTPQVETLPQESILLQDRESWPAVVTKMLVDWNELAPDQQETFQNWLTAQRSLTLESKGISVTELSDQQILESYLELTGQEQKLALLTEFEIAELSKNLDILPVTTDTKVIGEYAFYKLGPGKTWSSTPLNYWQLNEDGEPFIAAEREVAFAYTGEFVSVVVNPLGGFDVVLKTPSDVPGTFVYFFVNIRLSGSETDVEDHTWSGSVAEKSGGRPFSEPSTDKNTKTAFRTQARGFEATQGGYTAARFMENFAPGTLISVLAGGAIELREDSNLNSYWTYLTPEMAGMSGIGNQYPHFAPGSWTVNTAKAELVSDENAKRVPSPVTVDFLIWN